MTFWQTQIGTLLPVVIGGLLVLATQWFMERRKEGIEERKRRAEKFEELVGAIYDHHDWVGDAARHHALAKDGEPPPSPINRIWVLATIYFPVFENEVRALDLAADHVALASLGEGSKRIARKNNGGNEIVFFEKEWIEYLRAKDILLEKMRAYGSRNIEKPPSVWRRFF